MKTAMTIRSAVLKIWDFALAVVAAVAGALWLTPTAIEAITTELIAFFTIQAAIILPAMIFTAGLLRGDGLTLAEIERYQAALRRQMEFWITLLFLDLLAVAILIIGKAADWKWKVAALGHSTELGWVLLALSTFLGTLAVLRMVPFVRGVVSLLELNGLLAKKSVQAHEISEVGDRRPASDAPFEPPAGYGKILPHGKARR
jgi:hypothetical protein